MQDFILFNFKIVNDYNTDVDILGMYFLPSAFKIIVVQIENEK